MRLRAALGVSAAALVALAAPARAETTGHHHTQLPRETGGIALAPDGDVWFTEVTQGADRVMRLDPDTGTTTLVTDGLTAVTDLVVGTDGTVWLAGYGSGLGELDPDTGDVAWHTYDNDANEVATYAVGTGDDGTIWFVDAYGAGVGSVDPQTGLVDFTPDPVVSLSMSPDVVVDGEGAIWYSVPQLFGEGLRRFDSDTGTYSFVADPDDLASQPYALDVDAEGDVWFTDMAGAIGVVDDATATVTTVHTNEAIARVVDDAEPSSLTVADDGTIWFAGNGGLGRMETTFGFARSTSRLLEGPATNWVLEPRRVVADPSAGIWLTGDDVVAHHLPTCDGRPVTVDLGLGQAATDGDDVILGTDGGDAVNGLGGDDAVCGDLGPDQLRGGPGKDRIFGGGGRDGIHADAGGGMVVGGPGEDAVIGGSGADDLRGGPANDAIDGRAGNDRIDGGPGANGCDGGSGRDVLVRCLTDA